MNSKKYPPMMIAMLFSLLLVIVLFLGFRLLLNDKLVSDAIFKIPSLMNSHFYKTKEPPRKLSEINEYNPYFPGAYLAIKLNMIEYKPIGIKEEEKTIYNPTGRAFYYQVCATFLSEVNLSTKFSEDTLEAHDKFYEEQKTGYSYSRPSYFSHPKGRACYKFKEPIE